MFRRKESWVERIRFFYLVSCMPLNGHIFIGLCRHVHERPVWLLLSGRHQIIAQRFSVHRSTSVFQFVSFPAFSLDVCSYTTGNSYFNPEYLYASDFLDIFSTSEVNLCSIHFINCIIGIYVCIGITSRLVFLLKFEEPHNRSFILHLSLMLSRTILLCFVSRRSGVVNHSDE